MKNLLLSIVGGFALSGCVGVLHTNESVQQVKLLAEMAPVVSIEQLVYDTRLMNTATKKGFRKEFRDLLAESDAPLDPQAYVLKPQVVYDIASELVKGCSETEAVANAKAFVYESIKQSNEFGVVQYAK